MFGFSVNWIHLLLMLSSVFETLMMRDDAASPSKHNGWKAIIINYFLWSKLINVLCQANLEFQRVRMLLTLCPSWQDDPKSTILMADLLGLHSRMFSGFRSQWMIDSSGVARNNNAVDKKRHHSYLYHQNHLSHYLHLVMMGKNCIDLLCFGH